MERFLREIASLYWWLGFVGAGIAVNLFSHYVQKGIDVVLSKVSKRWQKRVAARKERQKREAEELQEDVRGQFGLLWSELRTHIQVTQLLVSTVACFGFAMLLNIRYEEPSVPMMMLILFLQLTGSISLIQTDRLSRRARQERQLVRRLLKRKQDTAAGEAEREDTSNAKN